MVLLPLEQKAWTDLSRKLGLRQKTSTVWPGGQGDNSTLSGAFVLDFTSGASSRRDPRATDSSRTGAFTALYPGLATPVVLRARQ